MSETKEQTMLNDRYARLVRGSIRAIGRIGRWTGIAIFAGSAAILGIIAFVVVGGMGLALMGTAVGIGPMGWISIMIVLGLAVFGAISLVKHR